MKLANYKVCQSCGMPLNKDELGGGTETNGSKSTSYCSHCYLFGNFTEPDMTVYEMQQQVQQKMKLMKMPRLLRWFFTRNIPRLKRWAKH